MLPTEPPLSLHRLLVPVPSVRPQEVATAVRQGAAPSPAPTPAPAPVSNATVARAAHPPATVGSSLLAGQDQSGNAAVAHVALRAVPGAVPLMAPAPRTTTPSP
ncbi:hypothetical protein Z951_39910 [Streptomyces sp. PRh5]|uniref:hypothetical protein n=1 Tax=Streptomyces sp. PRh5 TaxID=1158056 RepID=UPI0004476EC2|nr:hypothetical protein [Streptomyces sp. PRh5]EXU62703.1 hypothetical protein Z951_39910 [Streptomyces sp. PRh5]